MLGGFETFQTKIQIVYEQGGHMFFFVYVHETYEKTKNVHMLFFK